jgi:hypothetical protein
MTSPRAARPMRRPTLFPALPLESDDIVAAVVDTGPRCVASRLEENPGLRKLRAAPRQVSPASEETPRGRHRNAKPGSPRGLQFFITHTKRVS